MDRPNIVETVKQKVERYRAVMMLGVDENHIHSKDRATKEGKRREGPLEATDRGATAPKS